MKAYLIDPVAETVTEVEHNGDYREIYKLIEAEPFTLVQINSDVMYVDDEGQLKDGVRHFHIIGYGILAGKGLVLGSTRDGGSCSPKATLQELTAMVSFPRTESTGQFTDGSQGFVNHPMFGRVFQISAGEPIVRKVKDT